MSGTADVARITELFMAYNSFYFFLAQLAMFSASKGNYQSKKVAVSEEKYFKMSENVYQLKINTSCIRNEMNLIVSVFKMQ